MQSHGEVPTVEKAKALLRIAISTTLTRAEAVGIGLLLDRLSGQGAGTAAPRDVKFHTDGGAIWGSAGTGALRAWLLQILSAHGEPGDPRGEFAHNWLTLWTEHQGAMARYWGGLKNEREARKGDE